MMSSKHLTMNRPSFINVNNDEQYNLRNGFESLDRDCVQKLLRENNLYIGIIQTVCGISSDRLIEQTRNKRFKWANSNYFLTTKIIPHPDFPESVEIMGRRVTANKLKRDIYFRGVAFSLIDIPLNEGSGIYKLTVNLVKFESNSAKYSVAVGLYHYDNEVKCVQSEKGTHYIVYLTGYSLNSGGQAFHNTCYTDGSGVYKAGDTVALEVDTDRKRAYFMINNEVQKVIFVNVKFPLKYYVGTTAKDTVWEIVSLDREMLNPSVDIDVMPKCNFIFLPW